jgi:hypothetical protein
MPEEPKEREVGPALPWAFVLDPAANARALGEVQRRGLSAARELIERVSSTMDRPGDGRSPFNWTGSGPGSNGGGEKSPPELVTELMQTWWELTMNTMATFLPNWNGGSGNGTSRGAPSAPQYDFAPTVDVTGDRNLVLWRLEVDSKGSVRNGRELWLRNSSLDPLATVRLSVSDLQCDSGAVIASKQVHLDPPTLTELPARSARGVQVELRLKKPVANGTYRGIVYGEGAVVLHVPIEVDVRASPSET